MRVGMTIPIDAPREVRLQAAGRTRAVGGYGAYQGQMAMQFIQFEGNQS